MTATVNTTAKFPETKYMGSKQRLLPFIQKHLEPLRFGSCLDAFSGTSCLAHMIKCMGKKVIANDFMEFCFHVARSTVENSLVVLEDDDMSRLLKRATKAGSFIEDNFKDLYFTSSECGFLDNVSANIRTLRNKYKKSLALAALCRARISFGIPTA